VRHYFVNSDPADPEVTEHIGGMDPGMNEPTSIIRFLTLPTVRRQHYTKFKDPIFDFAQLKILTSDEYNIAAEELKLAKDMAERAKEQQQQEKQESRRRKAMEWEEWRLVKLAACEEAARIKELRAAEQAELQARRQSVRDSTRRRNASACNNLPMPLLPRQRKGAQR
jgi:hypothetical protein